MATNGKFGDLCEELDGGSMPFNPTKIPLGGISEEIDPWGVKRLLVALREGAEIVWEPPESPKFRAPEGIGKHVRADLNTTREVLRRAVEFRKQLVVSGPSPLLTLADLDSSKTGCISCGTELTKSRYRCSLCQAAAWIALEVIPPDVDID